MSRLHGRLRKLEAAFLDPVGLVPFSQKWIEYWDRQFSTLQLFDDGWRVVRVFPPPR